MIDLHPGGLIWRRTFPGTFGRIPDARHFTRYLLADAPCQDDAEQIVAELSANAIQHSSSGRPQGTFIVDRSPSPLGGLPGDFGWPYGHVQQGQAG
jgi:hypothetical protein